MRKLLPAARRLEGSSHECRPLRRGVARSDASTSPLAPSFVRRGNLYRCSRALRVPAGGDLRFQIAIGRGNHLTGEAAQFGLADALPGARVSSRGGASQTKVGNGFGTIEMWMALAYLCRPEKDVTPMPGGIERHPPGAQSLAPGPNSRQPIREFVICSPGFLGQHSEVVYP